MLMNWAGAAEIPMYEKEKEERKRNCLPEESDQKYYESVRLIERINCFNYSGEGDIIPKEIPIAERKKGEATKISPFNETKYKPTLTFASISEGGRVV